VIYSAVLADVDDTLIDSSAVQAWGWRTWAKGHDLDATPFVNTHGLRIQEKLLLFTPHLDADKEVERILEIAADCPLIPAALPGAAHLLATTPKIALVTSGARIVTLTNLALAGLSVPDVVVTADDVRRGKPDPEPYLTAAARLRVPPSDCIVLEDAIAGVAGGAAAGMTVVGVTTTTNADALREAGASLVVPDVAAFLLHRNADTLPPPKTG
jgi:sugar-phosphatase